MLKPTTAREQGGATVGVLLFVICLFVGGFMASYLGGTEITPLGNKIVDMTTISPGNGTFNWLIFTLFALAGTLCLAVGLAAATISATMHNLAVVEQDRQS